jgi:hypothetical protein
MFVTVTTVLADFLFYRRQYLHSITQKNKENNCNWSEYIVTYRSMARQRLGKHILAEANVRNNRTSIARQRISKHA